MATLTDALSNSTRLVRITGDASAARPGLHFRVDDEVMELAFFDRYAVVGGKRQPGVDPNRWYVRRGVDGTAAATHLAGTDIFATLPALAASASLAAPDPFTTAGTGGEFDWFSLHEDVADDEVAPGGTYFAPENGWVADHDPLGVLDAEDPYLTVPPTGVWLVGGYADTTNTWPPEATGWVSAYVLGNSGNAVWPKVIASQQGAVPAASVSATIAVAPVLIRSVAGDPDADSITLRLKNGSDQTITISGFALWGIRLSAT